MVDEERTHSIRGLVDTDVGPLRKFTGVFDSMPDEKKTYGEGDKKRVSTQISLNFKDIEVIEAIEPYHFPIFTVLLSESNRKKSKYGVFGQSLAVVLDMQYTPEQLDPSSPEYIKPSARMDLKDCIGKRMGLVLADGEEGRPTPPDLFDGRANEGKGGDVPTPCWTVYMVEGIGVLGEQGNTPNDKAMELLDGKTLAAFNKLALADPTIRADGDLLAAISLPASAPNSFGNTMITSGQFTKDKTGVFHKVAVAG